MPVNTKIKELIVTAKANGLPINKLIGIVLDDLEDAKTEEVATKFRLPNLSDSKFDEILTVLSTERELPGNAEKVIKRINSAMINKNQPKFWQAVFVLVMMNLVRYRR